MKLFKRTEKRQLLLSYNKEKLVEGIERRALTLHGHTRDEVYVHLREVFQASRNVQLLDMNGAKNIDEFNYNRGRVDALTDMCEFFTHTVEDQRIYNHLRDKMKLIEGSNVRELKGANHG